MADELEVEFCIGPYSAHYSSSLPMINAYTRIPDTCDELAITGISQQWSVFTSVTVLGGQLSKVKHTHHT